MNKIISVIFAVIFSLSMITGFYASDSEKVFACEMQTENKEDTLIGDTTKDLVQKEGQRLEQARIEEERRIQEAIEAEEARQAELERQRQEYEANHTIKIVITFYTSSAEENGGYAGKTCMGKRLEPGMVATVDEIPMNTTLETEAFGTLIVADRMSRSVGLSRCSDIEYPIDMYVEQESNENEYEYSRRVNNMGVIRTTAVVTYPGE